MRKTRPKGIILALLLAAEQGALAGLKTFTPKEIGPQLAPFLSPAPTDRQLSQSLWYAKKKGLFATQERADGLAVTLTYKGREHLLKLKRLGLKFKPPNKWDGRWRMVTFDIPESRRYARDNFRLALKRIGFRKLSGGLWIYPFEVGEQLSLIEEALLIKRFVRHLTVDSFDGQEQAVQAFGLTKQ